MQSRHLQAILKPIIRLCFNQSLGLHDVVEAAKVLFIKVAEEELQKSGEKISVSRLSVITGVHRKDAERIYRQGEVEIGGTRLSGKIISQWRRDRRFLTKNNRPRVLSYLGEDSEFAKLVRTVSAELKSGTILFDLERIGAVERTEQGLKLLAKAYAPSNDAEEGFRMLAGDIGDITNAAVSNIKSQSERVPYYHATGSVDNVSAEDLPKIREWVFKNCQRFHEKVMRHLVKFDLDTNPAKEKRGGYRFALGIFSNDGPAPR